MPRKLCRLCLGGGRLIYMFDERLRTQDQLRACILLSTGVEIKETDEVTKFVCNNCCTIAVKLFKFRRNAVANDKALKEYANQGFVEPPKSKEDIARFNSSLSRYLDEKERHVTSDVNRDSRKTGNAVHPSIISLFKRHPNVVVPNEMLRRDVDPVVMLDRGAISRAVAAPRAEEKEANEPREDPKEIDHLRKKLPAGLKIEKVTGPSAKGETTKQTKSDVGGEARRRQRANSDSPEVMPQKKRRVLTRSSRQIQKMDLPERSPKDIESKKMIFTSSLELTSTEKIVPSSSCLGDAGDTSAAKSDDVFDESESSFLEPLSNLTVVVCRTCSKIFLSKTQCRIHEKRVHSKCIVCQRTHEYQTSSLQHLQKPCREYIETNQPRLRLERAEDVPEIASKYADALSAERETFGNFSSEDEYLASVFGRLGGRGVQRESKRIQSFEPDDIIRYKNQNSLTLPVAYTDLQVYKVPVYLSIAQKMYASVSYTFRPKVQTGKFTWDPSEAVDLMKRTEACAEGRKQKRNSFKKTTPKAYGKTINNYISKHIDNLIDLNDKVLCNSSLNPRKGLNEENSGPTMNFNVGNAVLGTQPPPSVPNNACPNSQQENSPKIVNSDGGNKFVLRVKAPWELNQCK